METPFSASRTKIDRARKHLSGLESELTAFVASEPAKLNMNIVPGTNELGMHVVKFEFTELRMPPESLSVIVGDIFHNLRSALDLAACDLVRLAGYNADKVYFTFCARETPKNPAAGAVMS